jgi:CubicO group peptidase (beta-lactamase class C family)
MMPRTPILLRIAITILLATLPLAAQRREMTPADVEAFLDGLVPQQLAREDIAGAVVAVVKDGRVLFAKGYGYSDVATKKPVSPETTLFRPGSISKLFTWTSVMQLVEQGKLDLDADVNQYLDFNVPATFGKPLTLRNIMTHTSGFEETLKELFVSGQDRMMPLDVYVRTHLPRQIFPPGTTPAYSNYATALAGYIVQRVSGQPFERYVEDHFFKPLDMPHCTFSQPLPAALKPLMSSGYNRASDGAKEFEWVAAFPAGSSSVSALDMTHFMMAHLNDGEYSARGSSDAVRILRPATARQMHTRAFGLHPDLDGMALGFYEESRNGLRIIGHGGDTGYFHSDLHLVLAEHLGFFVSYNSAGKGEVSPRGMLWQAFLDRYYPYTPPERPVASTALADGQEVSGDYLVSRRPETTVVSIVGLLGMMRVRADSAGILTLPSSHYPNGKPRRWKEIGPLVYRDVEGQDRLAFIRNGHGFTIASSPISVYEKVDGLRGTTLNQFAGVASLAIMALALILWPVAALVRYHYGRRLGLSYTQGIRRFLLRAVCGVNLAFLLVVAYFASQTDTIGNLTSKLDPILRSAQVLGVLGGVGAIVAFFGVVFLWRDRDVWWWTKVQETLIALSCLVFTLFIWKWHLLVWSLRY